MTLVPTNESQEIIKKHEELWSKIKYLIRLTTKKSDGYYGRYMKIEFNSDDKLPLNKVIEIPSMIVFVKAAFHENSKYYLQVFVNEFPYEL